MSLRLLHILKSNFFLFIAFASVALFYSSLSVFAAANPLILQQLQQGGGIYGETVGMKTMGESSDILQKSQEEEQEPYMNTQNSRTSYRVNSYELFRLNALICEKSPFSRLCNNSFLQKKLQYISETRGVDFWLMVGIAQAESRLGTDFASGCDESYYNWGGVKARRLDSGKIIRDYPIPDNNGCWIYKFNSLEDYWISTANIIRYGYLDKGCDEEEDTARCISRCYVGGCGSGEEEYWINAVNGFREFPFAH